MASELTIIYLEGSQKISRPRCILGASVRFILKIMAYINITAYVQEFFRKNIVELSHEHFAEKEHSTDLVSLN